MQRIIKVSRRLAYSENSYINRNNEAIIHQDFEEELFLESSTCSIIFPLFLDKQGCQCSEPKGQNRRDWVWMMLKLEEIRLWMAWKKGLLWNASPYRYNLRILLRHMAHSQMAQQSITKLYRKISFLNYNQAIDW